MGRTSQLPVYRDAYIFAREIYRIKSHLKKDLRYTLGDEVFQASLENIKIIVKANKAENKTQLLEELTINIELIWTWLRMLYNFEGISKGQFKNLSERLVLLSKQSSSWKNWSKKKLGYVQATKIGLSIGLHPMMILFPNGIRGDVRFKDVLKRSEQLLSKKIPLKKIAG